MIATVKDIRFDDIKFVVDVLKSDFLTQGPMVQLAKLYQVSLKQNMLLP